MNFLQQSLRDGKLYDCEQTVAEQIRRLPRSPFHNLLEAQISNRPSDAANIFDHFLEIESQRFSVAAAYVEMNGFDINPQPWFCDIFAYTAYGGHDDYDWLARPQSAKSPSYAISGLESLQDVYASTAGREKCFQDARNLSSLLIVIKFQGFMKKVAAEMTALRFPLLVTAHDFDFIAEIRAVDSTDFAPGKSANQP
jgi:hypothetical protein